MLIRYTYMRIVKDGNLITNFDTRDEPSIYRDIMAALNTDLRYSGYGDKDVIISAAFYVYDNVKHWLIELTEDDE